MDLHKPKPWHTFREFLKEYLIIVVGVLTALSAEAGVEWLHWRHLAEQHEAELHKSAQTVAAYAVERLATEGCLRGELQEVAEALRRPGSDWKGLSPNASGHPGYYVPPALRPGSRPWPQAAWESALSDGTLSHIPAARFRVYAGLYRTAHDINAQQSPLNDLTPELTPLAFDQTLTPEQKARYLVIIARIDRLEALMGSMSRSMLRSAAEDGFWPRDDAVKFLMDANREVYGAACLREVNLKDFLDGGAMAGRQMPGLR
jgi:hypothetical protein